MFDSIRAIFFDWGRTLVSVDGQLKSWVEGAERVTRQLFAAGTATPDTAIQDLLTTFEEIQTRTYAKRNLSEIDFEKVLRAWFKRMRLLRPPPQVLTCLTEAFWAPWVASLDPLPEAVETVAAIRRRGYRCVLVSNTQAPPAFCQQLLERQGLAPLLDAAVVSSGVGRRKPHKAVYKAAMTALAEAGCKARPSEVLFVGDAPQYDVVGPMAMGMRAALIRNEETETQWSAADYATAQPDVTLSHVRDLLKHLPRP